MNNFEAFGNVFGQTPKKRVNPLFNAKPIVVTLPENKKQEKEEAKEEAKTEEIQVVAETTTTEPEEVKAEKPDSQEEIEQETEPETETNTEEKHPNEEESDNNDEEDQEEEEDKPEENTAEVEKPKKRRRRRTKAEMEAAKQEEIKEETDKPVAEELKEDKKEAPAEIKPSTKQTAAAENVKVTSGTFKFENVIAKFVPVVEDPKWDEQVKYIDEQMDKIKFDSDINAGTIRVMLPLIANLYNYIKKIKPEYETLCEQLISDSVGLIPRQKLANSTGSNSEERKKNGSMACENFKVETLRGTLNLYEFYGIALSRLNYLKAKIDSLESSKSALIGFLTVITKAEK